MSPDDPNLVSLRQHLEALLREQERRLDDLRLDFHRLAERYEKRHEILANAINELQGRRQGFTVFWGVLVAVTTLGVTLGTALILVLK